MLFLGEVKYNRTLYIDYFGQKLIGIMIWNIGIQHVKIINNQSCKYYSYTINLQPMHSHLTETGNRYCLRHLVFYHRGLAQKYKFLLQIAIKQ